MRFTQNRISGSASSRMPNQDAVIVDSAKPAIQAIERNAQSVLKEATAEKARVLQADYRSAIDSLNGERFDYVFLDPPYRMADAYADAALDLALG